MSARKSMQLRRSIICRRRSPNAHRKNAVNWGPSSDHSNGAIMHVFADDHVQAITVLCDPETYLNLTTRAGGEEIDSAGIQ